MKVNMKKILKNITMYVMVLMFCLIFADSAKAATEYELYICGKQVTSDNMSGDGWRFEPATESNINNRLYLTDANLVVNNESLNPKIDGQAINMNDRIEIILSGNNTINMKATDLSSVNSYKAIYGKSVLISGNGTLTITTQDVEKVGETGKILNTTISAYNNVKIKDGVKLNIEAMPIKSVNNNLETVFRYGICAGYSVEIYPNAQVNMTGFGVNLPSNTINQIYAYCIMGDRVTVHKKSKINISLDDIKASEIGCYGIYGYVIEFNDSAQMDCTMKNVQGTEVECIALQAEHSKIIINDNVKVNITIDSVETQYANIFGIYTRKTIDIGNKAKVSVSINNIGCNNGNGIGMGIFAKDFKIGNSGKLSIKVSDKVEDKYMYYIGFSCEDTIVGNNTTIDVSMKDKNLIGFMVENLNLGKDSIIKTYSSNIPFVNIGGNAPTYTIYGGNNTTDLNKLTYGAGRYTYIGYKDVETETLTWFLSSSELLEHCVAYCGENPAQYVEIGPLLTINLQCDKGTVNKKSIKVHNSRAVGTIETPVPNNKDCEFVGWYTAKSGGTKVTASTKFTKSMTLYARWKVKKPNKMTELTYSARTAATITLKWSKNTSATGYLIQQYKDGAWKTIKTITKNTTVSYKVSELKASTTYKFRIVPYKEVDGVKAYGGSSSKTVKTLPSKVKNFTYSARTSKTITLKWNKNTSADGYVIQQYKGGKWITIKNIYKNATVSHKVTGLKANTTYKFRIKAYKKDGSKRIYSFASDTISVKTL